MPTPLCLEIAERVDVSPAGPSPEQHDQGEPDAADAARSHDGERREGVAESPGSCLDRVCEADERDHGRGELEPDLHRYSFRMPARENAVHANGEEGRAEHGKLPRADG